MPNVLKSLVGKPIFQVEGADYCGEDAVLAGRLWGDWPALEVEVREGIACIRHMLRGGERPTAAEEEAAAAAFRQTRSLFSASETEAWLSERGLTVDNWLKYIRRTLLRAKWAASLAELVERYPARPHQVRRALKIVGICSGHFDRFARKLAGRAALFARLKQEGWPGVNNAVPPAPPHDKQAAELLGLTLEMCQARLRQLANLERGYQVYAEGICTADAIQRLVAARHTDWIRVTYRSIVLRDEASAREAFLCIRDDGEPFGAVARRAGVPMHEETQYLEQVDPALRNHFLSAKKEELIGPMPSKGGILLCQLVDKTLPKADEPAIRRRAEEVLMDAATQREVSMHVAWRGQGAPLY